jgi:hypothetical protein
MRKNGNIQRFLVENLKEEEYHLEGQRIDGRIV